jgi:hypothetical protein
VIQIFDALLILKDLHDTLEGWFRIVDACAAPKQPQGFFLSFTKKSKNNQKFSLLIFLHNLYKSLLNKFSLYFSEALFPFIPHGEIQLTVNSYYNSSNSLIQSLHTFSRKTNVHLLAIVTNQRSLYGKVNFDYFFRTLITLYFQDPFSGNDVNTATSSCEKDNKENRLEPLALCPKDKKLFELYMKQQVNELVQDHLKNYQDNRMKCLYNKLIDKVHYAH